MIVGAANDTLADASCADLLGRARHHLRARTSSRTRAASSTSTACAPITREKRLRNEVMQIGARTREVLESASGTGRTPLRIATERVRRILADARAAADGARSSGAARRGKTPTGR